MDRLGAAELDWVRRTVDADVSVVRGLREGGSPWLLAVGDRRVVLRVGSADGRDAMRVEAVALDFAAAADVRVPRLLAAALERDPPLVLVEAVEGTSTIPAEAPVARLRSLGAAAARLQRIRIPDEVDLQLRTRPIESVDFARLRAEGEPRPLLVRAEQVVGGVPAPDSHRRLVHGDLWQGNALWRGDELLALIDWDCAGHGAAGVDLGSLRCDAAICFGAAAAEHVLTGWKDAAGHAAADLAYWDVVAALSTPPDLGWFAAAIADQGRTDLTQAVLIERRDEFLAAALEQFR